MSNLDASTINDLSKQSTLGSDIVRAIAALSKGNRLAIKLSLTTLRQQLQSKVLTEEYKITISNRRKTEDTLKINGIQRQLEKYTQIFNNVYSPGDYTTSGTLGNLQPLIRLLVAASGVPNALSYKDVQMQKYKFEYALRQVERAGNIAGVASRRMVSKIAELNKYINLIDLIENV